jgi:hypothetical protein
MKKILLVVAVVVAAARSGSASLVGSWRFDYPTLGTDSSGLGNHLTAVGNPVFDPGARGGLGAVLLDGSSYFTTALFPTSMPTGNADYTITAWIQTGDNYLDGIISWGDTVTGGYNGFRVTGPAYFGTPQSIINYSFYPDDILPYPTLADGAWHFVAVSFDHSAGAYGARTLYADGVSQTFVSPAPINVQPANFRVALTYPWSGTLEAFKGELSDVRVYNTALAPGEISQIYGAASVPEPATFLLVGPAIWLLRRKRRG